MVTWILVLHSFLLPRLAGEMYTMGQYNATGGSCDRRFTSDIYTDGEFSTPHYPKPYPTNTKCRFIFEGTRDQRIRISFDVFELEPGTQAGCLFDYVDVFSIDLTMTKHLDNRMCGSRIPHTMVSVHPKVELFFKSDYKSAGEQGFLGRFEFVEERWQPFDAPNAECGPDYITGVGGTITSPGYPSHYIANLQCTWMIRVQHHERILLNFLVIDLGQSVSCTSTYVSIYNGFASTERQPVETLCGQLNFYQSGVKEFTSTAHRVVIRFISASKVGGKGFQIAWTAVSHPEYVETEEGLIEPICPGVACAGGEYCIDTSGLLCNPLPQYCIDASLRCNNVANCGVYDHSDEASCLHKIFLISLAIAGPVLLLLLIVCIVCLCRRRSRSPQDSPEPKEREKSGSDVSVANLDSSPSFKRHPGVQSAHTSPIKGPAMTYCPSPRYQHKTSHNGHQRYHYSQAPNGNLHYYPSDPNLCAPPPEYQQTYVSRSSPMIAQVGKSAGRSPHRSPGPIRVTRSGHPPYRMMYQETLNSHSVEV